MSQAPPGYGEVNVEAGVNQETALLRLDSDLALLTHYWQCHRRLPGPAPVSTE